MPLSSVGSSCCVDAFYKILPARWRRQQEIQVETVAVWHVRNVHRRLPPVERAPYGPQAMPRAFSSEVIFAMPTIVQSVTRIALRYLRKISSSVAALRIFTASLFFSFDAHVIFP